MSQFQNGRDAKEFLVSQIVEQADREGIPLTEVERKMLYFSETGWTLPDIEEINEQFDREYDQAEYEKKIGDIARNARNRARTEGKQTVDAWSDAVDILSREDHYLLVLIDEGGGRSFRQILSSLWSSLFPR